MAAFRFGLQPLANGSILIRATIQNGEKTLYKSTKHTIPGAKIKSEYKYWDKKHYRVRQLDNMHVINAKLSDWQTRWENYIKDCDHFKRPIDIPAFIASLDNATEQPLIPKPIKVYSLLDLANEYYNYIQKTHKPGTTKQYNTCIEDIELYQKTYGKVLLDAVNAEFYRLYGLFLIEKKDNYNNTINRKIRRIVTLMNYATDPTRKYTTSTDYKVKYTFKESTAARFPLLPEEVKIIKGIKLTDPAKLLYLDAFRFACETILRFSDVTQLFPGHKTQRVIQEQVIDTLDLTQIKTTHGNIVPLSKYAMEIWNKYANDKKKRVFPINNSQSATTNLKEIFAKANLNRQCEIVRTQGNKVFRELLPLHKVISFHMSRNTAITFQLSYLSPATVMQNSGIRKLETVLRYNRDNEDRRILETIELLNKKPAKTVQKKKKI